jgi:hypothetical protein
MTPQFFCNPFFSAFADGLKNRLPQLLLLGMMLAYVLIPHQGDYLDSLSLSPGLNSLVSSQIAPKMQVVSPFQAVLQGQPFAPESGPHTHAGQSLSHPENSAGISVFRFDPPPLQLEVQPVLKPLLVLASRLIEATEPHPPPQNHFLAQLSATILLI